MESSTQADINPSKDELEVQPISEIQEDNTEDSTKTFKSENSNTKTHDPPSMKRRYEDITKDPHFIESGLSPPIIKSLNIGNPKRDEHLIDLLSTSTFNFKANLTFIKHDTKRL